MNAPPTPPASVRGLSTDSKSVFLTEIDVSYRKYINQPESLVEHLFDWALRITGAACAPLFGVWAPLSYQLQKSGNKSDDKEMN
jgi:hypothetical protein